MRGSSPLTRGKPDLSEVGGALRRLIPAHAGKTSQPTKPRPHLPAHPRSRGENDHLDCPAHHELGSSPLTRGKRLDGVYRALSYRLIPAHAGKTTPPPTQPETSPAHPRSRGENHDLPVDELHLAGSSPLTRGKHARDVGGAILQGLIPAHAGKTEVRGACSLPMTAHPRSRGENTKKADRSKIHRGSSPLTRGKLQVPPDFLWNSRLIPAHAGKTTSTTNPGTIPAAHPRSRGENFTDLIPALAGVGSSPLTRGKPAGRAAGQAVAGLIPAHAGKTHP